MSDQVHSSASEDGAHPTAVRPFANQGHYTVVHDGIFDHVMPILSPTAFKVLMFVIRKTEGWKKESDALSESQIMRGTGIKSDDTVRKALSSMIDDDAPKRGLLLRVRDHDSATRAPAEYALNREYEMALETEDKAEPSPKDSGSPPLENGGAPSPKKSGNNNHPLSQEPEEQEPTTSPTGGASPDASGQEQDGQKGKGGDESLASYTMKRIYRAMKNAGYVITGKAKGTRTNEYGRLTRRVQWMLDNMNPSDAELKELPAHYVRAYTIHGSATDAVTALNELRRQKDRPRILAQSAEEATKNRYSLKEYLNEKHAANDSYYERREANGDKPKRPGVYVAFYPWASEDLIAGWIRDGCGDGEITARLERRAKA